MGVEGEMNFTHIDLFSGIGGFALACKWNGIETVQFVEIDKRCRDFLSRAWPGVPIHDDIRTFSYSGEPVFLLTGGVPCQPASRAGKQRGKEDDRWLWPEAIRVLGEVKPAWAIFENPPGIEDLFEFGISLDLDSEGHPVGEVGTVVDRVGRSVFHKTLEEIEAQGYAVQPIGIPACAVGSPQIRMRYWIVGHRGEEGREGAERTSAFRQPGASAHGAVAERAQGELADRSIEMHGDGIPPTRQVPKHGNGNPWGCFIWLPCADGKVRRAIGDSQRMAHGLPVELLEELGTEGRQTPEDCEVHRSILGALGNAIVWPVAAIIIKAIINSEID